MILVAPKSLIKVRGRDILTPANVISLIGLILTLHGVRYLYSWQGIIEVAAGRGLDVLDGPVARRTRSSDFGAAVDAVFDKLALAAILIAVWFQDIAPKPLLIYIALQNLANAVIALKAAGTRGHLKSSLSGKHTMFAQNVSIGCFILGSVLGVRWLGLGLTILGWIFGLTSVPLGLKATISYARKFL